MPDSKLVKGPFDAEIDAVPSDGEFGATLRAAIETFPPEQQPGAAIAFLVEGMQSFADHAVVPTQKRLALAYIEATRHLIPAEVKATLAAHRGEAKRRRAVTPTEAG